MWNKHNIILTTLISRFVHDLLCNSRCKRKFRKSLKRFQFLLLLLLMEQHNCCSAMDFIEIMRDIISMSGNE
jgi:hypothetical protein